MGKFDKEIKIIQELIKNFGDLTRTKVVKLLYLLDVEGLKVSGHRITDFDYKKYYYGPYDEDIVNILDNQNYFSINPGITTAGNIFYSYSVGPEESNISLDEDTNNLIKKLTSEYLNKSLEDILKEAYKTEQFRSKEFGEKIFCS